MLSHFTASIFICEDDTHVTEVFKLIVMNKLENTKINFYYTTDLRQNEENLEKTLITFKLDPETNKYKMINEEIKLLG